MNNNSFEITAGIRVAGGTNTEKQLQEELDKLSKKSVIRTEIKLSNGKKAIKEVETYLDETKNKLITVEKIYNRILRFKGNGQFVQKGKEISAYVSKWKDLDKQVAKTENQINQYVTKSGKVVTVEKEIKNGMEVNTKYISKYRDSLGNLVEETKTFNEVTKKWSDSQTKVAQDLSITEKSFKKYEDSQGRIIQETKELNSEKNGTLTRITEEIDANGRLTTTTERFLVSKDQEIKSTRQVVKEIKDDEYQRNKDSEAMKNQMLANKGLTETLGDFVATMGKVVKFQIITKIITGFTQAVNESITIVKDFDRELTEFKKVSDLSGDSLDAYTKKLGELGEAVARTRKHLCECV